MRQSEMLRASENHRPLDPAKLTAGQYVVLHGKVESKDPLLSPDKGVACVKFVHKKLRVVDQRTAATTWTHAVKGGAGRGFVSFLSNLPILNMFVGGVSTQRESKKEQWGLSYQEVASQEGTARVVLLTGPNSQTIALDLSEAEFLQLETVLEGFEPAADSIGSDGRRALGFKTIEQVLRTGAELTVIGEIGKTFVDGEEMLIIRASTPKNLLDIKTRSVSRPFVASPLSDAELLHKIERAGRIYFWSAMPALISGIGFLALAASNYDSRASAKVSSAAAAPAPAPQSQHMHQQRIYAPTARR